MIKSETELYKPVKKYFEKLGYTVNAEVKDCDLTAVKDDIVIIAELKKSFNMTLLYQLMDRKKYTPFVYAVIPRPKSLRNAEHRHRVRLLSILGIGLIVVSETTKIADELVKPKVTEFFTPRYKRYLLKEIEQRHTDLNIGGQNRRKIVTAHRESVIAALCYIEKYGTIKTKDVKQNIKNVLQINHYRYFQRVERGVYTITELGRKALENKEFSDVIEFYRKGAELCLK